jgi:hypothetical protein
MKHKSPFIAIACVAALAFLPASLPAASKKEPKPEASNASAPAATKASRPIPFHGMISAVDQSAKTFTIAGKTSTRVFKITDKTAISKSGAAATMKDITANEEVSGSYWKQADGLEAKTVKLGATGSAEKKAKETKKTKKEKAEATPTPSPEASTKP